MKNKTLIILFCIFGVVLVTVGVVFSVVNNQDANINNQTGNNSTHENNDHDKNTVRKEITCSAENISNEIKTSSIYTLTYEEDKLKKFSKILKYQYTEETEETTLRYKGVSIQNQVEIAKKVPGVDIYLSDENYVITNSYYYDLEVFNHNLSEDFSSILPIYQLDDSVTAIISEFESWEYTCK